MNLIRRLRDPELNPVRLDWRLELTHGLLVLMEAMWIAPWFAIILPGASILSPYANLLHIALNMLAALFLVRFLDAWGMWESLRQIVFLAAMLAAVLVTVGVVLPPMEANIAPAEIEISGQLKPIPLLVIPPFVPVLLLIAVIWWRGLRLALTPPTPTRAAFWMRLGILFLLAATLFPVARTVVLAALPAFFFFGLLGISMSRAISLREMSDQPITFGPRWMFFMAATAGAVTLAGFLIAVLVSGMEPDLIARIIQPILSGFVMLVALLMSPILYVVGVILQAIIQALTAGSGMELQVPEFSNTVDQGLPQQMSGLAEIMQQIQQFLAQLGGSQICVTVLAILLVAAVIFFTLRRQRQGARQDNEEYEDLDGDALGGLRDIFRRGLGALNAMRNAVGQFGFGRDLFAALTVRRAYAQMARLAARQGYPRAASQTPYEYRLVLQGAFPAAREEINLITEAYVRVHYGEVPEGADALREVTDALERFKNMPAPAPS